MASGYLAIIPARISWQLLLPWTQLGPKNNMVNTNVRGTAYHEAAQAVVACALGHALGQGAAVPDVSVPIPCSLKNIP